ncbi:MAG: type II toxin-antitoxin system VapC family toxin [Kiritimatiellia bacterium]
MIALDTNILIRFLARDDEKQAQIVYARFKKAEASHEVFFVPLLVVLETIWVLESAYGKTRQETLDSLDALKSMPILKFEKPAVLQTLLSEGKKNHTDLADRLIALTAHACGCAGGITFEKKAAKLPFFQLAVS